MNKFIKIFATVLLALFITACEKPNPVAEFNALSSFVEKQSQDAAAFQSVISAKLSSQDPAQIESLIEELKTRNQEIRKNLDALKIKSNEVEPFKNKYKANLELANELLIDTVKYLQNPEDKVLEQGVKDKTQKVQQLSQEVQQLFNELKSKYNN